VYRLFGVAPGWSGRLRRRSQGAGGFPAPGARGVVSARSKLPRTGKKWVKRGRNRRGAPTLQGVHGASGRVLVVDDNKVIRQLIRVNLELEGFEVVTAADGAECLDIVHQVRPDVVTLDVVMPRLDGVRTAAGLRADPRTRHLRIAIVSACTRAEMEAGVQVGVDAFLAKPFEPAELVRMVRRLMHRSGARPTGADLAEPSSTPHCH
jgi:CheY-like chemotaxis protein